MKRTLITVVAAAAVLATAVAVTALTGPPAPAPSSTITPSPLTPSSVSTSTAPSSPSGTPAPTFRPARGTTWLTVVPRDFSVSAGLPDAGGDFDRVAAPVTWAFCGTGAFPDAQAVDTLRDGATGPEYGDARDLRVFADDRSAHDFLTTAATTAAECPEERHGTTRWLYSVTPIDDVGDESVRILQTYETDGLVNVGATWWDAIRVGNAVLLTATGGEYMPGETLGLGIREHDRLLAPVVESMCVFAVDACGAPAAPMTLRHDGIGPVRLGMTADEARAAGARVHPTGNGTGCSRVEMMLGESYLRGDLDPETGISMLWGSDAVTPEGISTGSTLRDLRQAYAPLTGDAELVTSQISRQAMYRFEIGEGGLIDSMMLVALGQGCAS